MITSALFGITLLLKRAVYIVKINYSIFTQAEAIMRRKNVK